MPPAAPSFAGAMPTENNNKLRISKKLETINPSTSPRRLRKGDSKKDENDIRFAKRHKANDKCEDENCEETVSTKRRRLNEKIVNRVRKEPRAHHGDLNLALSGDEDNADVDFSECSSDDESEKAFESSGDEDSAEENLLKKKKKYYVVHNDGRPAELYRTDLIHSLRNNEDLSEDSDEESGPGNGLLRLTDRWREEWNHGVQVPMNPKALPAFKVAENDLNIPTKGVFRMPTKYIGIRPEGSAPSSYVSPATHACTILPQRLLYQADRLDEIWLEELNKNRDRNGKTKVTMMTFLNVMNTLEVNCYERIHQLLIAPLHSPNFDEVDEEAACDICRGAESEPDDNMVFCDGCNMCVHMSCYGLTALPEEEWICQKCALGYGFSPPCLLCPTRGGALKCTKKMEDNKCRWAHVACALWIPECRFGNAELREPITSLDEIPDERWQMKCCVCDTRQGACIQCTFPSCRTAFHVTCGLRSGLEMRIDQDPDPNVDAVRFHSFCTRHSVTKSPDKKQIEEDYEGKENIELQRLESHFYLQVDYEIISKASGIDKVVVSDVYEYWKLKRTDNNGKPLIRNPHDEIKLNVEAIPMILPQISCDTNDDGYVNSRLNLQSGRLQKSLDMGRSLLYLVVKREKEKHRELVTQGQILENIWEQSMMGVPISQRVVDSFCEVVESLMSIDDTREVLLEENVSSEKVPTPVKDDETSNTEMEALESAANVLPTKEKGKNGFHRISPTNTCSKSNGKHVKNCEKIIKIPTRSSKRNLL